MKGVATRVDKKTNGFKALEIDEQLFAKACK